MKHINFYRKYRPNSFAQVIGQNVIITILKNTLMQNKLHHAYLFSGMQGVGKTSTARILACAANCLQNQLGDVCLKCDLCLKNQKFFYDIIEIDAASHNGVEQIRNLREQTMVMPSVSKYKVFIIDEVHMLSKSAFNAFLKILEEPPKYILFILATTEIAKIPATILSRCQRFHFQAVATADLTSFLSQVAKKELLTFEQPALETIANYSNGCVRDALNVLEQVAFSNFGHKITQTAIIDYFGFLDETTQMNFLNALFTQDKLLIRSMITNFAKSSINFMHLSMQMLEFLKNQLFHKIINSDVAVADNKIATLSSLQALTVTQLQQTMDLIFNTLGYFRYHLKPKLVFEIMCLHILAFLQTKTNPDQSAAQVKPTSPLSSVSLNDDLCKIAQPQLLRVLQNKEIKLFTTIKMRWKALAQYALEPRFQSLARLFETVSLVTCSNDTILVKTTHEKVRNQINNLQNNQFLQTFSTEWLDKKYIFYALTVDELYNLKLSYQKGLKD